MKILLIDDELFNLYALIRYLRSKGHEVLECESPITALQLIETYRFDCIITDYYMLEMTGIELAINVRSNPKQIINHTPIMLLTGWSETAIVDEASKAGINLVHIKTPYLKEMESAIAATVDKAIDATILYNKLHIAENQLITAYKQGK